MSGDKCDDVLCESRGTLAMRSPEREVWLCTVHRMRLIAALARGGAWVVRHEDGLRARSDAPGDA